MIRLRFERHIARPIEEVFARLVDIDGYEDWLPHSSVFRGGGLATPGEEVGEGTEFTDETPVGTFEGRITSYEAPRRVAFEQRLFWFGKPVFDSRPSYLLEPTDEGTHLTHNAEGRLHGIYQVTEPLLRRVAIRERSRIVDELKRSIEDG